MEDDDIELMFSKHNKGTVNMVKCVFDVGSVKRNAEMLSEIEKNDLRKFSSFYDKEECDDNDTHHCKEDYFTKVKQQTINNAEMYCGYLDKVDIKSKHKNTLCCGYCFTFISDEYDIIEHAMKNTMKGVYICNKSENTFKDYECKYNVNSLLNEYAFLNKTHFPYEQTSHEMFISLKCIKCALTLGIYDGISHKYILFNCI